MSISSVTVLAAATSRGCSSSRLPSGMPTRLPASQAVFSAR
ncbi:hypothetical protein [Streptomyces sp. MRC013]|nr:hypothetical protein [Streptomyces sp. MRC013]